MKAIVIPAEGAPRLEEKEWSLAELQEAVGGYIERVRVFVHEDEWDDSVTLWADEEGKFGSHTVNRIATRLSGLHNFGDYVAGDAVLIGHDGNGEACDVPGEYIGLLLS